ncbi:hypothetical protein ACOME3_000541 [Neoechinorhynchus agilis]
MTWDDSKKEEVSELQPCWNFTFDDIYHVLCPPGSVTKKSKYKILWNNFDEVFSNQSDRQQEYVLMLHILQTVAFQIPRLEIFKKLDEVVNLSWTSVIYQRGLWRHHIKDGPGFAWLVDDDKMEISFTSLTEAPPQAREIFGSC